MEVTYDRLEPREHVLSRSGMYLGSIEPESTDAWVFDDAARIRRVTIPDFVPGLLKVVDEALTNCMDHVTRQRMRRAAAATAGDAAARRAIRAVTEIRVDIDDATGQISVYNDGDGIDVVRHEASGLWVPDLIFGHLMSGSNFGDSESRDGIGGTFGIGAKACAIFSTSFTVETVDARRGLRFVQTWRDNMADTVGPALVEKVPGKSRAPSFTRVTFTPDFQRFGLPNGLTADMASVIRRRVVDMAMLVGGAVPGEPAVKVVLDGAPLDTWKDLKSFAGLFFEDDADKDIIHDKCGGPDSRWEVALAPSPTGRFEQVSFVNGVNTVRGGRHVDHVVTQVVKVAEALLKKGNSNSNVRPQHIRDALMVFVKCTIPGPTFDSQTKETLTTPVAKFGSRCELSEKTVAKWLALPAVKDRLSGAGVAEADKAAKKTDGRKRAVVRGIPKLEDALYAGTAAHAHECTLLLTEGDSAASTAISGLSVVGRERFGVFPLRGKVLNVRDATDARVADNAEIAALKRIIGLESKKTYNSVKDLRYGRILLMTDQDVDGHHITGLLLNLFDAQWPSLARQDGFLASLLTPIVKAFPPGGGAPTFFYSLPDFEGWMKAGDRGAWRIKYYKECIAA